MFSPLDAETWSNPLKKTNTVSTTTGGIFWCGCLMRSYLLHQLGLNNLLPAESWSTLQYYPTGGSFLLGLLNPCAAFGPGTIYAYASIYMDLWRKARNLRIDLKPKWKDNINICSLMFLKQQQCDMIASRLLNRFIPFRVTWAGDGNSVCWGLGWEGDGSQFKPQCRRNGEGL